MGGNSAVTPVSMKRVLQVLEISGERPVSHFQFLLRDRRPIILSQLLFCSARTADFNTGRVACFPNWEITSVCVSAVLVSPKQKLLVSLSGKDWVTCHISLQTFDLPMSIQTHKSSIVNLMQAFLELLFIFTGPAVTKTGIRVFWDS